MKKILLILSVMLLLTMSLVSAEVLHGREAPPNKMENQLRERDQIRVNETLESSNIVGLENAMTRVRNEETQTHLANVWTRIQAKDQERLRNMSGLVLSEEDTGMKVRGVKEAKFLGLIKMNKTHTYTVNEDGTMALTKNGMDFLFKMQE